MQIKWKTLAKGFIWESIGGTMLFFIAWYTTGSAIGGSLTSIVYAVVRALMFYPYERAFKYVTRWYANRNLVLRPNPTAKAGGMPPVLVVCRDWPDTTYILKATDKQDKGGAE